MKDFRWIKSVIGREIRRVWLLCLTKCSSALIAVGYALLMQKTVDAAVARDAAAFWPALALFAAALLTQVALMAASKWIAESAQARIENALRSHACSNILDAGRLPKGQATGEIATMLTSDATYVAESLVSILPEASSMAVRAIAALALMFSVAPALAALFVIAGVTCVAVSLLMRRWLKRLHTTAQEAEGSMRARLQKVLESLVVIRSFGASERAMDDLGSLMRTQLKAREHRTGGKTISSAVFNLAMQASYLAGFGYGCWGILTGRVSYGTLMALVQLVGQIRSPFASLSGLFPQVATMAASCERLRSLNTEKPQWISPLPGNSFSKLSFRDVEYSYPNGLPVFKSFSAEIKKGEFVAITGASGIGKSTMLTLALGMEDPLHGTVEVEYSGSEPQAIKASSLTPGTFAYVPQGNMLMSGSIRDTVALTDPLDTEGLHHNTSESHKQKSKKKSRESQSKDEKLKEALYVACADGFVDGLPNGMEAILGEKGSGLSEGQVQRLAVARAVYSGSPVLLLDECTSALDPKTEREMLDRMRDLGRTVIIVTHRSAAQEVCDRVIDFELQ